jgi:F0F1-type ATP synthase delta subunit
LLEDFASFRLFVDDTAHSLPQTMEVFQQKYPLKAGDADLTWLTQLGESFFADLLKLAHQNSVGNSPGQLSEKVVQILTQMRQAITDIKAPLIYLPFAATDAAILEISNWFKKNVSPEAIFDVNYDGELIGGCALSINGNYRDYSLRVKIDESKEQILRSLVAFKTK